MDKNITVPSYSGTSACSSLQLCFDKVCGLQRAETVVSNGEMGANSVLKAEQLPKLKELKEGSYTLYMLCH